MSQVPAPRSDVDFAKFYLFALLEGADYLRFSSSFKIRLSTILTTLTTSPP